MYRAYGLFKPDSDFDLNQALERLRVQFPDSAISRTGDAITIARGDWEITMALVAGPHVPTETQGLTEKIAGWEPAEADAVIASDRRVEVWSETPDPFMEHFNDYLKMIEVLKSFRGVIPVDPHTPSLM